MPDFSLNDDNKAGNIFNRYLVRVSPATDDKNDKALVLTGVAVSYKEITYNKSQSINLTFYQKGIELSPFSKSQIFCKVTFSCKNSFFTPNTVFYLFLYIFINKFQKIYVN